MSVTSVSLGRWSPRKRAALLTQTPAVSHSTVLIVLAFFIQKIHFLLSRKVLLKSPINSRAPTLLNRAEISTILASSLHPEFFTEGCYQNQHFFFKKNKFIYNKFYLRTRTRCQKYLVNKNPVFTATIVSRCLYLYSCRSTPNNPKWNLTLFYVQWRVPQGIFIK